MARNACDSNTNSVCLSLFSFNCEVSASIRGEWGETRTQGYPESIGSIVLESGLFFGDQATTSADQKHEERKRMYLSRYAFFNTLHVFDVLFCQFKCMLLDFHLH